MKRKIMKRTISVVLVFLCLVFLYLAFPPTKVDRRIANSGIDDVKGYGI